MEWFGRYYGVYRGSVYDNKDPEGLGRLRVMCPQIFGSKSPGKWVFPRGVVAGRGHGMFWIPQPGDPIYLTFVNGDKKEPLWEHGWWLSGQVPDKAKRSSPDMYLLQTPKGLTVELDDKEGTARIATKDGFHVLIGPDGIEIGKEGGKTLNQSLRDLTAALQALTVNTAGVTSSPPQNLQDFVLIEQDLNQYLS